MNFNKDFETRQTNTHSIKALDTGDCPACYQIGTVKKDTIINQPVGQAQQSPIQSDLHVYECYHCHQIFSLNYAPHLSDRLKYTGDLAQCLNDLCNYV